MKSVDIFTDGACSGNPGPGGFGVILRYNNHEKELCGFEKLTTNNRMELLATITGLSSLKEPCAVSLYTDSKYIVDSINKGWLLKWEKNNWIRGKNDNVPNSDLWKQLIDLIRYHNVNFIWVKGHAGHPENERCDRLAVEQIKKYK